MQDVSEREFSLLIPKPLVLQATSVHKVRLKNPQLWTLGVVQAPRYFVSNSWDKKGSFFECLGDWLGQGYLEVIENQVGILTFRLVLHTEEKRNIIEFSLHRRDLEMRYFRLNYEDVAERFGLFWKLIEQNQVNRENSRKRRSS